MEPEQGYKTQSAVTGLMGIAGIIGVFVLSLVFGI